MSMSFYFKKLLYFICLIYKNTIKLIRVKYRIDKGNYSVYCLQFHYVACVKYRHKSITDKVAERLKPINLDVASEWIHWLIKQSRSPFRKKGEHSLNNLILISKRW